MITKEDVRDKIKAILSNGDIKHIISNIICMTVSLLIVEKIRKK